MKTTKFSQLRDEFLAGTGTSGRLAAARDETDKEIEIFRLAGESLEESPEALRAAARPIAYGQREISGLSQEEADAFAQALDDA